MKFSVLTGPNFEPVSLDEAKAHLRVDHTSEDDLIATITTAARRKVEAETGRALIQQTVQAYWDEFPDTDTLCLPVYPAIDLSNVMYTDDDGVYQVWEGTNYTADLVGASPRIVRKNTVSWPDAGMYPNAVRVTYTAGSATVGAVPAELKQAILLEVGLLYERREDMPINGNTPGVRSASWLQFNHRTNLI